MTKSLEEIAEYFADAQLHDFEQVLRYNIDYIQKLEKALEIYQKERDRFNHTHPELTGVYFLTGGHGEKDVNLLPEYVTICPAYGAGWEQVYKKTDRTISYEGS